MLLATVRLSLCLVWRSCIGILVVAGPGELQHLFPVSQPLLFWPQALLGEKGFLSKERLSIYNTKRNNPNHPQALSQLSPFLHYGHLSAQRAALEASKLRGKFKVRPSFNSSVGRAVRLEISRSAATKEYGRETFPLPSKESFEMLTCTM